MDKVENIIIEGFTYQWNKARFLHSSWLQSHFAYTLCSLSFLSISRINVGKISLTTSSLRARSIKPKFPEIPVQNQMEWNISKTLGTIH